MDSSDRPVNSDSCSPFLRDVQSAFKRHHGMTTLIKPRRLVLRGETAKTSYPVVESRSVSLTERAQDSVLRTKNKISSRSINYEAASVTPPDISGKPNDAGNYISVSADPASFVEGEHSPLVDDQKKVQCASQQNASFNYTGPCDHMETGLTKMECDGTNPLDVSTVDSQDRKDKFLEADGGEGFHGVQNERGKPSLMERNSTAHNVEWSDSTENSDEGLPTRPQFNTPKKKSISPSSPYYIDKLQKRRKNRRWTAVEEDTLRTGVRKYGQGKWKLILSIYHDIFEDRTQVDLKDKWRNLTRADASQ